MTTLKPSEYKDSVAEWFGELPTHWVERRGGALVAERNETGLITLAASEVMSETEAQTD